MEQMWQCFKNSFKKEEFDRVTWFKKAGVNNLYLFLIVLGISLLVFLIHVEPVGDDVFIYFRVAKNIANGTGPVLNPGDSHFSVTSPLWVYLLAFLYKITPISSMVILSKYLGIILLGFSSCFAFLVMRRYIGSWAALVPFPIFFNLITLTMLGSEIPLIYFGFFGLFWAYSIKQNYFFTGLFAAAAYLARGELIFLLPILFVFDFISWKLEKNNPISFRTKLIDWIKLLGAFFLIVSIWHIYYVFQFHALFPNTLKTKIIQGKSGRWQLYYRMARPLTLEMLHGIKFLAIPLFFGIIYFRITSWSLLAFTFIHFQIYKALTIPYYHWYFYDLFLLIPVFTLFGMIAFLDFTGRFILGYFREKNPSFQFPVLLKIPAILLVLIASGFCIITTTHIKDISLFKSDSRLESYTRIAKAIKPSLQKGEVLLSKEIGIVGYYLENAIIRDTNGIASPDITVETMENIDYFVSMYSPRYILFPVLPPQRTPEIYFFMPHNKLAFYKQIYPENPLCNPEDSLFSLQSVFEAPQSISILDELRRKTQFIQRSSIISIENRYAIVVQPPHYTRVKIPVDAIGFNVSIGFIPQCFCNVDDSCKECEFTIYGIQGKTKAVFFKKKLLPLERIRDRAMQHISLSFIKGYFEYLEFTVDQFKTPLIPCAYWAEPRFITK